MKNSVSIVKCSSYDEEKVLKSLRSSIDLIGGIQNYVKNGDRVLLKPNLLYGKAPEKAVTTHPSIIKGIIQIIREVGGIPFIGDSPSIGGLERAAEKAGIKKISDENKCPLVEFDKPILSPKKENNFFKQIEIDQKVLEADVVINLPKWKTHGMMLLTLGIKNLFGCIPGPRKAMWHLKAGYDRKLFAQVLVDLYQTIQPHLTILDGIVGMEGNGPGSGDPIPLGLILTSGDSLNIDQVVCDLLRIPKKSLMTNQVALERGLGKDGVHVIGEKWENINIPRFKLPPPSSPDWDLPGFLQKVLKKAFVSKPVIEEKICSACNRCVEVCPIKALDRKKAKLVFDDGKCIRCFCCQEICPEGAISIKPGWAMRFIGKR